MAVSKILNRKHGHSTNNARVFYLEDFMYNRA